MSKQYLTIRKAGDGNNLNRFLSTISAYIISIVVAGLVMLFAPASHAQISLLQYMMIPTSGAIPSGITTFNLPGYGLVKATLSPTASYTSQFIGAVQNQRASFFYWNAAYDINVFTASAISYTVKFEFIQPSSTPGTKYLPPDPTSLVLVVDGLGLNTTALVSQPVYIAGEVTTPGTGGLPTTPTAFVPPGTTGTKIGSGICTAAGGCDSRNTGWALLQTASATPITLVPASPLVGVPTLTVMFSQTAGDGIGFTLGYGPQPNPCCPPWNQDSMLAQVALTQPGNSLSNINYFFLNQEPVGQTGDAQMQAYIDYLHSLNPSINNIILDWRIYDYGSSIPPGTGPTTTPVQIGLDVFTEWSCTGCPSSNTSSTIKGGNGALTSGGPPPVLLNIPGSLPVNRWYGIYTGIYLNDGIQFWDASCNITLDYFTVVATDPPSTSPSQMPVHVIKSGGTTMSGITFPTTGGVMMLPRLRIGQ